MGNETARFCSECEYYIPCIRPNEPNTQYFESHGICDRVDDPSVCFAVEKNMEVCIYENPGKKLTEEQIKKRFIEAVANHSSFMSSLERASKEVASWPVWKQESLANLLK